MPTAYCSLNDAYGDWDNSYDPSILYRKPTGVANEQSSEEVYEESSSEEVETGLGQGQGVGPVCPSCHKCIEANNRFQQQVYNQTIAPRPQWIQTGPEPYLLHDPFNRYWSQREYFGNPGLSTGQIDTKILLKVLLVILVTMFIIQMMECFKNKS
jgi:hypothetical protein